jgi:phosphate:Na+ symporter
MNASSAVTVVGGLGLFLLGIHHLTEGLKGLAGDSLRRVLQTMVGDRLSAIISGALFTVAIQSSTATTLTVIGFVSAGLVTSSQHAGSLSFDQACAMIVGQSVGTAATSAMVAIGAGLAVRRAALAHIVYNVAVGVIGILLIGQIAAAAHWVGAQLDDPDGVLALATFSSIFKSVGILAFYPWLDRFARLIERISGAGIETAVSRLDPVIAEAGGAVALEAAWRAILELAHGSIDAVGRRIAGESVRYEPPIEAARQTEQFLESLSLETLDLTTFEPRLVRLCHALDHLSQLHDDFTRIPPEMSGWQRPAGFEEGARALASWLETTKDPEAAPGPAIFKAMESASKRLADERETGRDKILQDVALQRMPAETARNSLEMLAWADGAFYHAWRLAESLRIASGKQPAG